MLYKLWLIIQRNTTQSGGSVSAEMLTYFQTNYACGNIHYIKNPNSSPINQNQMHNAS